MWLWYFILCCCVKEEEKEKEREGKADRVSELKKDYTVSMLLTFFTIERYCLCAVFRAAITG